MAQQRGTIATWNSERGFGFITPEHGNEPVFFHRTHVVHGRAHIAERTAVSYTLTYDDRQRPQAIQISVGRHRVFPRPHSIVVVACFFLALAAMTLLVGLPIWLLISYLTFSSVTVRLYARDKAAAVAGQHRIPEGYLHGLELLGGWPGALIAQQYFRHKTRKTSYQTVFWIVVVRNLCALASLVWFIHPRA